MKRLLKIVALLFFAILLFAADPFAGTWKVNTSKSKYSGDQKPPKDFTVIVVEQGDRLELTGKGINPDGSPLLEHFTVPARGGSYQWKDARPGLSGILKKRTVDSRIYDFVITQNGKVTETGHAVAASDGKSFRWITKGSDAHGKPYQYDEVYNRIQP